MNSGVGSDQEVGKNTTGAKITLLSPALRVTTEGSSGRSPDGFVDFPIDGNPRVFKEGIDEIFAAARAGDQFSKNGGSHGHEALPKSRFQGCLYRRT